MLNLTRTAAQAWTGLWRVPVITIASLATLVIGIGSNALVFAVVYAVLLKSLPFPDVGRLVQLDPIRSADARPLDVSIQEFSDWRDRMTTLDALTMFGSDDVVLGGMGDPETVRGAVVSGDFFSLLGAQPALGRLLNPQDDRTPAVVLAHRLWLRRFGGDLGVVGRTVAINGRPYVVAGVAGDDFRFPDATDLWTPLGYAATVAPPQWNMRGFRAFSVIGRLRAGTSMESANHEATATAEWLAGTYPRFNGHITAAVVSIHDRLVTPIRPALLLLTAAAGLVLLVALASLTSLTLTRSLSRMKEFAVRSALGANRRALVGPLIAESALLGLIGGAASLAVAAGGLHLLRSVRPDNWPSLDRVGLDLPVLVTTLAVSVLTTLLAGVLPVLRASKAEPIEALRHTRVGESSSTRLGRRLVVSAQIAISIVLLVGGSLLTRSLLRLMQEPVGIRADGVLTLTLNLASRPANTDRTRLLERVLGDIAALPGVDAAGVISNLPPAASQMHTSFSLPDPVTGLERDVSVEMISASPDAFSALGTPLLAGRGFTPADSATARRVIILSATAARQFFPDGGAVGQTVAFGSRTAGALPPEVVGIVGDVKYSGLHAAADGAIYMPVTQRLFERQYLVVRTDRAPLDIAPVVRRTIADLDPALGVSEIRALEDVVHSASAQPRFWAWAVVALAGVTICVVGVGLFSLVSRMVTAQTPEIGLRIALGSSRGAVVALIIRHGLWWTLPGVGAGLVVSAWASRGLEAFLFGVRPADTLSFALAPAIVVGISVLASLGPARRAMRIDPLIALKNEDR